MKRKEIKVIEKSENVFGLAYEEGKNTSTFRDGTRTVKAEKMSAEQSQTKRKKIVKEQKQSDNETWFREGNLAYQANFLRKKLDQQTKARERA